MLKKIFIIFGAIFVILAILIAILYYYPQPEPKIPELNDITELDQFIEQVVADNGLPSLSVAIVDSSGIRHHSFSGARKKGGSATVTKEDLYHLGSNTKAMTSVLTAMIIDDGLLNWDTKIIEVLPELSDKIHSDFHNVTIHELLTHRSGMKANFSRTTQFLDLEIKQRRLKIIETNLKDPPKHKRGEFLYSNLGYITAGTMLEQLTKKSWETLIEQRLFTPLKMKSAGFGVPGTLGKKDQPWGHLKLSGLLDFIAVQNDNPAALGPAGTVHCSMEDWSKFISFQLMDQDTSLLSINQRTKLLEPIKNKYACGWSVIEPTWADSVVYTHAGTNTMNFSQCWVIPSMNKAILINSNAYSKNMRSIFRGVRNEILEVHKAQ